MDWIGCHTGTPSRSQYYVLSFVHVFFAFLCVSSLSVPVCVCVLSACALNVDVIVCCVFACLVEVCGLVFLYFALLLFVCMLHDIGIHI